MTVRGNGLVAVFHNWSDFIGAIDVEKAAYHSCDNERNTPIAGILQAKGGILK